MSSSIRIDFCFLLSFIRVFFLLWQLSTLSFLAINSLDLDGVGCLFLLFVYNLRIDLSGTHVSVSKHLTDSIDVGAIRKLQCSKRMAGTMKGDVLCDAGCLHPFGKRSVNP